MVPGILKQEEKDIMMLFSLVQTKRTFETLLAGNEEPYVSAQEAYSLNSYVYMDTVDTGLVGLSFRL
jgi:hypothetical protein